MVKLNTAAPESGDEFELITEGDLVNTRLESVELREFTYNNEPVKKLRWNFTITDEGPWMGKTVNGETSEKFTAHPNCRAYNWVAAISGRSYNAGEELDTDVLIGLPERVMIGHKPGKDGRVWMRVKEVFPAAAAQPAPGPEQAPF